ncbi:MAG: glycine--tRNA ligase subunit beta, partial [Acidobacteriota bacterium]
IEIGCEEIPARMLPSGARDLARAVTEVLDRAGLTHGEPELLWGPRRLAVRLPQTQTATRPTETLVTGPPAAAAWDGEGQPTRAASGFAAKHGASPQQLLRHETERGVYAALRLEQPARPLGDVLSESFERAVAGLTFGKMMRWGDGEHTFVRPVHWLVALADREVLGLSLFGIAADRWTRGHRVLFPGPHAVPSANVWEDVLEGACVTADPQKRRERLSGSLQGEAQRRGGRLVEDAQLLDEVADILEWPAARAGSFEAAFVAELPEPVLRTCLKHHQKAFSVRDERGVLPAFAVGVNMPDDPQGHIQRGHEWVVSGRLHDALFFWNEDRKRALADRLEELDGILFQHELGTVAAKTRRLIGLVDRLGAERELAAELREALTRAARLSRCDLTTGLVGEFPELQGVVGSLLAHEEGSPNTVVAALRDFHAAEECSAVGDAARVSRLLRIADRLDTLVGCFAVGLVPSGSKDPFALRRAATTAVRLALEEPALDLLRVIDSALDTYRRDPDGRSVAERADEARPTLVTFLFERFSVIAERRIGARYDEIAAVRSRASRRMLPTDLMNRLQGMQGFRSSDDFLALAAASKRVRNILLQAAERGEPARIGEHGDQLTLAAERALGESIRSAGERVQAATSQGKYAASLAELARLRPTIDRFFDEVLVMDEDATVRRARLSLIAEFDQLANSIVDLSELVVERK